jgi:hypothetical protein
MNYSVRFHSLTEIDYKEAYDWYESKSKGLGERFMQAIRNKLDNILLYPEAYGSKDNKQFREAQVDFFPFLIVYMINKKKKEIYIASIHHTKKDPRKKYRR